MALQGYEPSLAAAVVYIVVFALITLVQTIQVARSRVWWLSVLVVGGVGEVVGWAGRLWASYDAYNINAFLTQIICLILAPCFFSATIYGILGMIVRSIGPQYSLLKPWLYLTIFCIADLIAIVIQAIGGAKAAIALQNDEESSSGTHIMVAGICVQLFSMLVFCVLALDVYRRTRLDKTYQQRPHPQEGKVGRVGWGLAFASFWILLRCCYRVAELAQGWSGYLITHEPYFCVLDSMAMVFAQGIFIFTWPNNERGYLSRADETLPRTSSSEERGSEATRTTHAQMGEREKALA
ncbi:hypothetical protein JCM11641_003626 [Rhodosporidiobolus odoratus]